MIVVHFMSAKDSYEKRVMHSKSDSIEIMTDNEADEFIGKLCQ